MRIHLQCNKTASTKRARRYVKNTAALGRDEFRLHLSLLGARLHLTLLRARLHQRALSATKKIHNSERRSATRSSVRSQYFCNKQPIRTLTQVCFTDYCITLSTCENQKPLTTRPTYTLRRRRIDSSTLVSFISSCISEREYPPKSPTIRVSCRVRSGLIRASLNSFYGTTWEIYGFHNSSSFMDTLREPAK